MRKVLPPTKFTSLTCNVCRWQINITTPIISVSGLPDNSGCVQFLPVRHPNIISKFHLVRLPVSTESMMGPTKIRSSYTPHHWVPWSSLGLPLTVSRNDLIGLPFWYRLTRVVPEKGPLNGCVRCLVNEN